LLRCFTDTSIRQFLLVTHKSPFWRGYVSNDTKDQDMITEFEDFCTWVFVVVDDICGNFTEGLTNLALKGGNFH
jgi:hypothetical protein